MNSETAIMTPGDLEKQALVQSSGDTDDGEVVEHNVLGMRKLTVITAAVVAMALVSFVAISVFPSWANAKRTLPSVSKKGAKSTIELGLFSSVSSAASSLSDAAQSAADETGFHPIDAVQSVADTTGVHPIDTAQSIADATGVHPINAAIKAGKFTAEAFRKGCSLMTNTVLTKLLEKGLLKGLSAKVACSVFGAPEEVAATSAAAVEGGANPWADAIAAGITPAIATACPRLMKVLLQRVGREAGQQAGVTEFSDDFCEYLSS